MGKDPRRFFSWTGNHHLLVTEWEEEEGFLTETLLNRPHLLLLPFRALYLLHETSASLPEDKKHPPPQRRTIQISLPPDPSLPCAPTATPSTRTQALIVAHFELVSPQQL